MKNFLAPEQKERLQQALNASDRADVRDRILMLLLLDDGKTYAQIAEFVGCSKRTVAYWCVRGDPENLESFKDNKIKGNARKVTDEYIAKLLEIYQKTPQDLGYDFKRWTGEKLATHLERETGISISASQIRRILQKQRRQIQLSEQRRVHQIERQTNTE
ncbi:MAG: helix-turn-helix domain-containing protein [Cyanobacteria bacterium P01_E01_bin.42]